MNKLQLLFITGLLTTACFAQSSNQVTIGTTRLLYSNVLQEERNIYLYSPAAQTVNQNTRYPLIIIFDAETLFELLVSTSRFMCYSSEIPQMPEAVIVGIPNTDRNRDMPMPSALDGLGEKNFSQFVSDELLPFLTKHFPLNGHTIIIGHSQGGLFVSYLLARKPLIFPWILSFDAPINIDPKTDTLQKDIARLLKENSKTKYVSIENAFGWGTDWSRFMPKGNSALQVILSGETHESIPGKGMYDGLKFLFQDFAPVKKDLSLLQLKKHYETISLSYGYHYQIPLRILLGSASRNLMEHRKKEVLELTQYAETIYGTMHEIDILKNNAATIALHDSSLADYYLGLRKPSADEVLQYIGIWKGSQSRVQPPSGEIQFKTKEEPIIVEISIANGVPTLFRVDPPWARGKRIEQEVFSVSKNGELIFGYKNMGSGVIVSTAKINKNGNLAGSTQLMGYIVPEDMPEKDRSFMDWIKRTPQTFELIKQ